MTLTKANMKIRIKQEIYDFDKGKYENPDLTGTLRL